MDERGWLKGVLEEARAEVNSWPEWMREATGNLGDARSGVTVAENVAEPIGEGTLQGEDDQ
jgi:hypothetical protein